MHGICAVLRYNGAPTLPSGDSSCEYTDGGTRDGDATVSMHTKFLKGVL